MTTPTHRLVLFTSMTCGACIAMKKSKVLEEFSKLRPEVEVIDYCVANEDGETPEGSEFAKNDALADKYDITHLPTLVFETMDGGELIRIENPVEMKPAKLDAIYQKQIEYLTAKKDRLAGRGK